MNSHLFGNPHSHSPSSMLSTNEVESTRIQALRFFNADPEYFDLIFVANATAAIKLVADCFSDYTRGQGGFWYGYHADAHTSLVGVREVAGQGSMCFHKDEGVNCWVSDQGASRSSILHGEDTIALFGFPGQGNMNGRRLPLLWPQLLRCSRSRKIYSLLDAAALVATAPLDLSDHDKAPDFIALSFYKIFGFPDLGALIVRKAAGHVLRTRRYFGGGTVDMVINRGFKGDINDDWFARKATSSHEMLEDGTPPFHSIVALRIALDVHKRLYGSMANVSRYCANLVNQLYREMSTIRHANGFLVCQIYKDAQSTYGDSKSQGPTIAFNVQNSRGHFIGKSDFETLAILNNIQIRTGGLCNPGGIASALNISPAEMRENFEEGVRCGNEVDQMHGKPTGLIRVSLGAMSSEKDVSTFLRFLRLFVDKAVPSLQKPIMLESSAEKSSKVDCVLSVRESSETFMCPIAACSRSFNSKDELSNHLPSHRDMGR